MSEEKEAGLINVFELAQQEERQEGAAGVVAVTVALKAEPVAPPKLEKKVCQLVQQLLSYKQVRKGVNEVMKALQKGGIEAVVLAADCDPLEIVMTLPSLCEERNIPYCFVSSKASLGRACGIKRPVVAACITHQPEASLQSQILELRDNIEQLFV